MVTFLNENDIPYNSINSSIDFAPVITSYSIHYTKLYDTNTGVRDCPECHLRIDKSITPAQIIQLKSICNEHPGMTKMFIHILDGYNDITIECTQTIALNDHIIEFAESIGQLSYKPIPLK